MNSVSKGKVISMLNHSSQEIIKIGEENEYDWYITRMEQGKAYVNLKQLMWSHGWKFKDQMGAGYIFSKNGKEIVVETQMWTSKYVLCQVRTNSFTLE